MADPLARARPAEVEFSSRAVLDLLDDLSADGVEMHSLMVLHRDAVVAEGWWSPYRSDQPHLLYSLSKSVVAAAVGFAVDEGLLALDDRLVDVLAPWAPEAPGERASTITVRHALTMTTGHTADPIFSVLGWAANHPGGDWLTGFLELEPAGEPGEVFAYNQLATYTLARAITHLAGEPLTTYLRPRLFDPIGIGSAPWLTDLGGHPWGFSGLHLCTEDIARFGRLLLADGVWDGRRVLPEGWVTQATSLQVLNDAAHRAPGDAEANPDWMQGYGFQFWRCRHGYRGDGALGQFCLVWPDEDVVVVTTAAALDMQKVLDRIEQHLVPALGHPTPDHDDDLVARLGALVLPTPADHGGHDTPVTAVNDGAGSARRLRSVTLRPETDGWTLAVELTTGPGTIPVGRDRWVDGTWPNDPALPVATAGGWRPDGRFLAVVAFVATPHHLELLIDPEAGTVGASWTAFPLHGSDAADFAVTIDS